MEIICPSCGKANSQPMHALGCRPFALLRSVARLVELRVWGKMSALGNVMEARAHAGPSWAPYILEAARLAFLACVLR